MKPPETQSGSPIDRPRGSARCPINPEEVPFLDSLGALLRHSRESADLSRWQLGFAAEISERQVAFIEDGMRRTRASTLKRIAVALTPDGESAKTLLAKFLKVGGPAIAAESQYADRIARRRARRARRREAETERAFRGQERGEHP